MTNEDFLIVFLLLVFIGLLLWVLIPDTKTSHSGATEPSRLPLPPKPEPRGTWYLCIEFLPSADTPTIWIKADEMQWIVGDPKKHQLVAMFPTGGQTYNNVERYSFVQMSQMGDWLITEEELEQPEEL